MELSPEPSSPEPEPDPDPELSSRIDVLFFEHHVGAPHAMASRWWGYDKYGKHGNITTSFELFIKLSIYSRKKHQSH